MFAQQKKAGAKSHNASSDFSSGKVNVPNVGDFETNERAPELKKAMTSLFGKKLAEKICSCF